MRYRRFALGTHNVHVQVRKPRSDGQSHTNHTVGIHSGTVQVVEQASMFVVVGNKPKLSPGPVICQHKLVQLYGTSQIEEKRLPETIALVVL